MSMSTATLARPRLRNLDDHAPVVGLLNTTSASEGGVPAITPSAGYEPIGDRHSTRPFHPSVYSSSTPHEARTSILPTGFPRNPGGPARPWVPGVSTPEGIIVASAAVVLAGDLLGGTGEAVVRTLQAFTVVTMTSIAAGLPTAAIVFSDRLLHR